jgi:hypothetical protein
LKGGIWLCIDPSPTIKKLSSKKVQTAIGVCPHDDIRCIEKEVKKELYTLEKIDG